MPGAILIINTGSSSIKFAIIDLVEKSFSLRTIYRGEIAGIGHQAHFTAHNGAGEIIKIAEQFLADIIKTHNHEDALAVLFDWVSHCLDELPLTAVGHRVVHGGEKFSAPVSITKEILSSLKELIPLAPLHQPYQIVAIEALLQQYPEIPQIACFDTAFHRSQPLIAQQFSLPESFRNKGY